MTTAEVLRDDLRLAAGLIATGSNVLELGCGDGTFLEYLRNEADCHVFGVAPAPEDIASCISRGVPVIQADIDRGLAGIPDEIFDVVVVSQTLQVVRDPRRLLRETLRVGHRAVVAYANFAHATNRTRVALDGRMPVSETLPYNWYDSPNIRFTTIKDFRALCAQSGTVIVREIPLYVHETRAERVTFAPNLRANLVIVALERA